MKKFAIAAAAGALALGLAAAPASAAGVKVGVLTCHVSSGWGFVFGSSKDLHCNYRPNDRAGEHYIGTVKKFGVDLGYTEGGELIWGVIAPTSSLKPGALEGGYGGATASAAVGIGAGANVLVGGFDKSITLQPLSVEGMKGVNVAAGIGAIDLKYTP